jgi:hypothetical protein
MQTPTWLNTSPTWCASIPGFETHGVPAIGFSLRGWLAAEIVATTHHAFSKLMLVDAAGIKPQVGEITDLFLLSPAQIVQLTFHDPHQAPEYDMLYGGTRTPNNKNRPSRIVK